MRTDYQEALSLLFNVLLAANDESKYTVETEEVNIRADYVGIAHKFRGKVQNA